MEHIVLNRLLVQERGTICCFGVVDGIGVSRRSQGGSLSLTFRGENNFTVRGVCPDHMKSVIAHGDPVLIYAEVTKRNNCPLLLINQLQSLNHEQKEFVRCELEKCGVGEKAKKFGLNINSSYDNKQEVLLCDIFS